MEREYIVVVKRGVDLEAFDAELAATTGMGPIPNRSVEVANPRIGSKRMTHWMLTDEEAEVLKGDLRVLDVEIPPEQRDDIVMVSNATQENTFYRSIDGTTPTVNTYVNWGLRRCNETSNVYGSNNTVAGNYDYALDGTGVDIVIQDSGVDPDHPEWQSTHDELIEEITAGVSFVDSGTTASTLHINSAYAVEYGLWFERVGGTIHPADGSSTWQHGKQFRIEFFDTAGNKITEVIKTFRMDLTLSGGNSTPFNIANWHINASGGIYITQTDNDLGTLLGTQSGKIKISLLAGESRLWQIDWYKAAAIDVSQGTQSTNYHRDLDGHGTHCAGIAAGKTYGWAKGALIIPQKLNGLETIAGGGAGGGTPVGVAFDYIRIWHNYKNNGRPTVVNMSWGYSRTSTEDPTEGTYRGTAWTYGVDYTTRGDLLTATGVQPAYYQGGTQTRMPVRIASIDAEIEDMIDAGIHVCIAAGNQLTKIDIDGGSDFDNEVTFDGASFNYHRGSSPFSNEAFMVGNIDSQVNAGGVDRTALSTNRGPGVNIFAPGTNIMSTTSTQADASYTVLDYPDDNNFQIMAIGGTSMAAPQVAGVCALYLQSQPNLRPNALQNKMLSDASVDNIWDTGSDDDYTNFTTSMLDGPNKTLYSRYGTPTPWGLGGTINISGGS